MKMFKLFISLAILFIVLGFALDEPLSIRFVTSVWATTFTKISFGASGLMLFFGLGYYLSREAKLNKTLLIIHIWSTFIGLAWFFLHAKGVISSQGAGMVAGVTGLIALGITAYAINIGLSLLAVLLSR